MLVDRIYREKKEKNKFLDSTSFSNEIQSFITSKVVSKINTSHLSIFTDPSNYVLQVFLLSQKSPKKNPASSGCGFDAHSH